MSDKTTGRFIIGIVFNLEFVSYYCSTVSYNCNPFGLAINSNCSINCIIKGFKHRIVVIAPSKTVSFARSTVIIAPERGCIKATAIAFIIIYYFPYTSETVGQGCRAISHLLGNYLFINVIEITSILTNFSIVYSVC